MIDSTCETLVTLAQAADHIPRRRRGRKVHVSTLYRWATSGCKGVRLETLQVGGCCCTSREAASASSSEQLTVLRRDGGGDGRVGANLQIGTAPTDRQHSSLRPEPVRFSKNPARERERVMDPDDRKAFQNEWQRRPKAPEWLAKLAAMERVEVRENRG